jgi:hypothetical protein
MCPHKHKTNEHSKLAASQQKGAKAQTETASTPTSKGTSPSIQEKALLKECFFFINN